MAYDFTPTGNLAADLEKIYVDASGSAKPMSEADMAGAQAKAITEVISEQSFLFEDSVVNIKMDGDASVGISPKIVRSDHVHPSDTSKEPAFNKNTAFNKNFEDSAANIEMDGVASAGTSANVARADHIHPSDTNKINTSVISTDVTLSAESDALLSSQKAVKTYIDALVDIIETDISTVQSNLTNHANNKTTHGITGDIVGTTDTQTLSNKIITGLYSQNYLINGGFDFWQRGITTNNPNSYVADRWLGHLGQSGSITYARDTDVPNNGLSKYSARLYAPSGVYNRIEQRIESVNAKKLYGKTVTFSFMAKGDSSNLSFSCLVCRPESQQDTYNPITQVYPPYTLSSAMSASWTKYTYSFIVTAEMANYGFSVILYRPNTADNTFYITQAMLNEGSVAQPFTPFGGSYISDLQACLRYYEKTYNLNTAPGTYLGTDTEIGGRISISGYKFYHSFESLKCHKRNTSYTVTFYCPDGTINAIRQHATVNLSFPTTRAIGKNHGQFEINGDNTLVPNALYLFLYTVDAEI